MQADRIVVCVALGLVGWSCASDGQAVAPDATASSAEQATSHSAEPPATAADRAEACASAVESLPVDAPPEVAMQVVVEGCLPVYREPGCREGMQRAISPATEPSERVMVMSTACGNAYCPRLADPKPAFCRASPDLPPSERMALYGAFRDAMLELELGAEGKRRVLAAFEAAAQRRRAATPP